MIVVHFLDISSCLSQKISKTCFIINEFKRKKNKKTYAQPGIYSRTLFPINYIHLLLYTLIFVVRTLFYIYII